MKKLTSVLLALLLMASVLGGCGKKDEPEQPVTEPEPPVEEITEPEIPEEPKGPTEIVSTLAVCGDVMSHLPVTNDAWNAERGRYDYLRIMGAAEPYVSAADYAVANFETTLAGGPEYSGYPTFNSPDALADGLKAMGFDLMLTANNHSLDKRNPGLIRTLDIMDEVGLAHVGTSRTQEEFDNNMQVVDIGGISAVFLGYTYGTNGIPLPKDAPYAVNLFNTDYMTSLCTPDTDKLVSDLAAAKALDTDLVVVMMHWGAEYKTKQNDYQDELAELLLKNGADIVLGGHSHVPQPMGMQTVTLEDGSTAEGFVSYSLGNFISSQNDPLTDTTAVLTLELTKDLETGETSVSDYYYQPMLMLDREAGPERFELLDVYKELETAEPGSAMETKLKKTLEDCWTILGKEYDAVVRQQNG